MEWSWTAYGLSAAAVILSGVVAWAEGNWRARPGLGMGFSNHGGMWSDLVLLSMANAAIVPQLTIGTWIAAALVVAAIASLWVHVYWYRPQGVNDHLWPRHRHASWWRDLSRSGWMHLLYVIAELTLLIGFVLHPAPADVVIFVAAIFTVHVPVGLLQPRWFVSRHIATIQEQPLLAPLLLALWGATILKLG